MKKEPSILGKMRSAARKGEIVKEERQEGMLLTGNVYEKNERKKKDAIHKKELQKAHEESPLALLQSSSSPLSFSQHSFSP